MKFAGRAFLATGLLCALGAGPAPPPPQSALAVTSPTAPSPVAARSFEETLDLAFATGDFVGLAVAVVEGGETTFLKTWGTTEAGGAEPITPSTVFRVASLSKGFAASLAVKAAEEGLLALDAPAATFSPELRLPAGGEKRATLEHLLSHRVGLTPNAYDNLLEAGTPVAEILGRYRTAPRACPVGQCYAYQNIAFDQSRRAIIAAYGSSYDDIARVKLFAPLGMRTASVGRGGLVGAASWARPHTRDRLSSAPDDFGPWRTLPVGEAYYKIPAAGGVNASLLDMAAWARAQLGHAPETLSAGALATLHAPRVVTPSEVARLRPVSTRYDAAHYGLGWRIYDYEGAPVIAHAGTVDGYAAQIALLPDRDVGLVILSNARSRRLWRILPTFLDERLGLSREDWLALEASSTTAYGSK